jgi:Spy/CpxP family protein refolding chaperone
MSTHLASRARALLLASLAINLILATWFVVHAPWRHAPGGPDGRHGPVPQFVDLRSFRRVLPEERRDVIDAVFAPQRPALRERLGALFQARRAVREAMRAEPFDRAALDAAFERLREAETEAALQTQATLGDVLQQLTPEERRQFADLVPRRGALGREPRRERERGTQDPRSP